MVPGRAQEEILKYQWTAQKSINFGSFDQKLTEYNQTRTQARAIEE
jgi:hypothetical protein